MAVPVAAAAAPAIAAAVDGFTEVTSGAFQTLATMNLNNNKRKVLIEQIKGDVEKYLAKLERDVIVSKSAMDNIRSAFESQLDNAGLSFQERMECLDRFTQAMLLALDKCLSS